MLFSPPSTWAHLLLDGALGVLGAGSLDDRLDLVRVDDAGNVGVLNLGLGKVVVDLGLRALRVGAVDLVELLKGGLGPDDEATEVTTRGELEEVQVLNRGSLNTRDVAEGLLDTVVLAEDDEGATALDKATVAGLADAGTELLAVLDTLDVSVGGNELEESDGILGLGERLGTSANDEGNLGDL